MANVNVTVVSGANRVTSASYIGKTVADIREELAETLELTGDETSTVLSDGVSNPVDDDYVLESGDRLTFSRVAGQKGSR